MASEAFDDLKRRKAEFDDPTTDLREATGRLAEAAIRAYHELISLEAKLRAAASHGGKGETT